MTTSPETQRDELARDIFIADNSAHPNAGAEWDAFTDVGGVCGGDYAYDLADGLLAAGYRKPRPITTVEELDALPDGSVVMDGHGISLHKHSFTGWVASDGARNISREMLEAAALPATVLWEPDAEATR